MKKKNTPSKYQLVILEQLLQRGIVLQSWKREEWEKEEVYIQKYLIDSIKVRYNTFKALQKKGLIKQENFVESFMGENFTYSASPLAEQIIKQKYQDQIKKSQIPFHDFIELSNLMKEYLARRNDNQQMA
jgi:hypothetical protein